MTCAIGVASILVVGACNILSIIKPQPTATSLPRLSNCDTGASVLCVVSFGTDINNQMLINFIKPTPSFPDFYLKIQHLDTIATYECRTVENTPTSIYCMGDRTPLGDPVDIEVYSKATNLLIARGTLVIAAFALPTQIVVSVTPSGTPTEVFPVTSAPTIFEIFTTVPPATQPYSTSTQVFSTPTQRLSTPTRTKTPTLPAYPNP
jgi:hypothetical protein